MQHRINQRMKTTRLLALGLISLSLASAFGQPGQPQPPPIAGLVSPPRAEESKLTKFNLDFPGGTPQELVNAIQKAMGKPLNAIIPEEFEDERVPPLRMNEITVPELFKAIEMATMRTDPYVTSTSYSYGSGGKPNFSYQQLRTSIGFRTDDKVLSDNPVWYFHGREKIPNMAALEATLSLPKVCRFYALSTYLERGLTVDDITTAIQTGWKMLGDTNTPTINYHKDTKLLIAVGEPTKLETIDAVLKALTPTTPPAEKNPEAKPAEKKANQ